MLSKRKLTALALSVLMGATILFGGCSSKTASANPQQEKVIKVGTSGEYFPWCFKKDDKLQGFEIDVWDEIGKRSGYKIEYKVSKFSGLFGMLDAGQIDTIAHQISTTEKRREKYDFSETYAYSPYMFFVKKDSTISKLEDLKGKKVGVVMGSNGEKNAKEISEKNNLKLQVIPYDGTPIEKDVEVGRLDASFQGMVKALTTIKQGNLNLKPIGPRLVKEVNQYPFARNDKNKQIIADVNKAIKSMHEDGTFTKISEKWFGLDTTKQEQ